MTLATASGSSSFSISAADIVLSLGSTACCSARTQLIAQTGVTLAATSGFSSLPITAAAFPFRNGRHTLLFGARS
jgi:hypothetical protein